jgi:hypothetical protein
MAHLPKCILSIFLTSFFVTSTPHAAPITFEQFSDGQLVTTEVAGITFSNGVALKSGLSLNEFEFPPQSGSTVLADTGGPITIVFETAISAFSGYFTYLEPLAITAFDEFGNEVATGDSAFASNLGLTGDTGSSPNELLSVTYLPGIFTIEIAASPFGDSFTLDDMSLATSIPVPEPNSLLLVAAALGVMLYKISRIS